MKKQVGNVAEVEGKQIECSACWAHPRTTRHCYCEAPTPPRDAQSEKLKDPSRKMESK